MTNPAVELLEARRAELRLQLQAQRQLVAAQIKHIPAAAESPSFPRSKTLQLLTGKSTATSRLFNEGAQLLIAKYLPASVNSILVVTRLMAWAVATRNKRRSEVSTKV